MIKRKRSVIFIKIILLFVLLTVAVTFCRVNIPENADCYYVYPYGDGSQIDSQKLSDTDASRLRELLNGRILFPNLSRWGDYPLYLESYYLEFRTEKGRSMKFHIRRVGNDGTFAVNNMYFCTQIDYKFTLEVLEILTPYTRYLSNYR